MYDLNKIKGYVNTQYIGQTAVQFEELKSTSAKAKSIYNTCPDGMVVLAECQTEAKMRFGRQWYSPMCQNIYISIILKPNFENCNLSKLVITGTSSVCEAVNNVFDNIKCQIKWPNDILIDNQKICSINCEEIIKKNKTECFILYIGMNVNMEQCNIEESIKDSATSLKIKTGKEINREQLVGCMLNSFEMYYNELKRSGNAEISANYAVLNSSVINKYIELTRSGRKLVKTVKAVNITDNGDLKILNSKGETEIINLGEVSVAYDEKTENR